MKKITLFLAIGIAAAGLQSTTANLIINGNFTAGNTGFLSDYQYKTPPNTLEGQYYVISDNAITYNGGFISLLGQGGSGNYLIVNGGDDNTASPWFQTVTNPSITLTTNVANPVYYRFEAQVANIYPLNGGFPQPDLSFEIAVNGNSYKRITSTPVLPPGTWNNVYADTYFTSIPTSLSFRLRNQSTSILGNDFTVDNTGVRLTEFSILKSCCLS